MSDKLKTPISELIDRYFELKNDARLNDKQRLTIMLGAMIEECEMEHGALKMMFEHGQNTENATFEEIFESEYQPYRFASMLNQLKD